MYYSPYVFYITDNGSEAYIDVEKGVYTWDQPTDIGESYYITREDVKVRIFLGEESTSSYSSLKIRVTDVHFGSL